jgi:DNA-binding HxlR family transcriptional regulator
MAGSVCSRFHAAVELIGARWTGAIISVLMRGRTRYADLRASVPEISDRMLSERLRELERAGIVERHVSRDPPVRVDYELTEKGHALEASLTAIQEWADRWVQLDATAGEPQRSLKRR